MNEHLSGVFGAQDTLALESVVARIVAETPATDVHTHLFAPPFGELLLYGVDELLTYHYLVAEVMRVASVGYDAFWAMDKQAQADLIWKELFIERAPISEACRGVLASLKSLGLDVSSRNLASFREYFNDIGIESHIENVFRLARIESVVMTNDPFDDAERPIWLDGYKSSTFFHAALRIDPLLLNWPSTCSRLKGWGYETDALLSKTTVEEVRRFLDDWLYRTKALYMAASLSPDFTYPQESASGTLLEQCVLPVARECGIPFAMMIGVERQINPALRLAGDSVCKADIRSVERLCARYPENKFMVTMLARENQHELCVAARKFRNMMPFGCWWFLNTPGFIDEITRMRLELLGLSMTPQHSDSRVLEQVIYKWEHSRAIIGRVLAEKYVDLATTGWTITEAEIRRDVQRLLGGNFWEFVK